MVQPAAVYGQDFLDTIGGSHRVEFQVDLFYNDYSVSGPPGTFIKTLGLVGGSITADRSATVRRTASISVDPSLLEDVRAGALSPYGYYVRLSRGVQYIGGQVELKVVFTGRIEQIDASIDSVELTCSDYNADVVDNRFEAPWTVPYDVLVVTEISRIIRDVNPFYEVLVDTGNVARTGASALYEQDRQAALDELCASIGCEWYADMNGQFHIGDAPQPLTEPPDSPWIVDTGEHGVLVTRSLNQTRTEVYNAVIATGESLYGLTLTAMWKNEDPDDPLRYGGPFGKVPLVMDPLSTLASPEAVQDAADKQGKLLKLQARNITIECLPNPSLQLSQVIEVRDDRFGLSGFYFVTGFELPMQSDDVMRITAMKAM